MIGGDLDRGGGHQPDPLARVEVHLGQRPGARPDLVGHHLVEDLLADAGELGDGVPGDERQRRLARLVRRCPSPRRPTSRNLRLLPGEPADVARREELPAVQAAGQVEDRGALHHGVVDVEERRGVRVGRRARARPRPRRPRPRPGRRRPPPAPGRPWRCARTDAAAPCPQRRARCVGLVPRSRAAALCQTAPVSAQGFGNLADLVRENAARRSGTVALVFVSDAARSSLTWAELDAAVDATAAGLRADLDLHPGDRVALSMANTPAFVTAYFGVLRAGLVAVPLNTGYTAPESRPAARRRAGAGRCCATTSTLTVVRGGGRRHPSGAGRPGRPRRRSTAGAPGCRRVPDPAAAGEDLAVLALHHRHQRPAARGDAHPPGAAGQPSTSASPLDPRR